MRLEYFQMVDRITALDPQARRIAAACQVPDRSPVFDGHFPGYPLLPGVLMIETMAQTGGWLVLAANGFTRMGVLMQVEKAKMRNAVRPGAALRAEADLLHDGSGYAVVRATLASDKGKVAEADIRYAVFAFPNDTLKAAMLDTARRIGVPADLLRRSAEAAATAEPPAGRFSPGHAPHDA